MKNYWSGHMAVCGAMLAATLLGSSVAHSANYKWVGLGYDTNFAGNDEAFTSGGTIKDKFTDSKTSKMIETCNQQKFGSVATCWDARSSENAIDENLPRDFKTPVNGFCAYKNSNIRANTPASGDIGGGHMYVCGDVGP